MTSSTALAHKQPSDPIITSQQLIAVSKSTYVSAMQSSLASSKFALQMEMAVGLAVFAETGRIDRQTKRDLLDVYVASGFDAVDGSCSEYKTVNRRVNAMAGLFEHIGPDVVREWIGGTGEMMVINALVQQVAQLQLKSVDGILNYIGRPRAIAPPKTMEQLSRNIDGDIREVANDSHSAPDGEQWPFKTAEEKSKSVLEMLKESAREQTQAYADIIQVKPVSAPQLTETSSSNVVDLLVDEYIEATATPSNAFSEEDAGRYEMWLAERGETPTLNTWEIKQGYRHITTESKHIKIALSPNTTMDELQEAIKALTKLAEDMAHKFAEDEVARNEVIPEDVSHDSPAPFGDVKVEYGNSRYKGKAKR